jgi:hypothetical protein
VLLAAIALPTEPCAAWEERDRATCSNGWLAGAWAVPAGGVGALSEAVSEGVRFVLQFESPVVVGSRTHRRRNEHG